MSNTTEVTLPRSIPIWYLPLLLLGGVSVPGLGAGLGAAFTQSDAPDVDVLIQQLEASKLQKVLDKLDSIEDRLRIYEDSCGNASSN